MKNEERIEYLEHTVSVLRTQIQQLVESITENRISIYNLSQKLFEAGCLDGNSYNPATIDGLNHSGRSAESVKPKFEGIYCSKKCSYRNRFDIYLPVCDGRYNGLIYLKTDGNGELLRCQQCLDEFPEIKEVKLNDCLGSAAAPVNQQTLRAKIVSQIDKMMGKYKIYAVSIDFGKDFDNTFGEPSIVIKFKEKI